MSGRKRQLIPLEIKSAATFSKKLHKGHRYVPEAVQKTPIQKGISCMTGRKAFEVKWKQCAEYLQNTGCPGLFTRRFTAADDGFYIYSEKSWLRRLSLGKAAQNVSRHAGGRPLG